MHNPPRKTRTTAGSSMVESPATSPVKGAARHSKSDLAEYHDLVEDIPKFYEESLDPSVKTLPRTRSRYHLGDNRPDKNTIEKVITASPRGHDCSLTGEPVGGAACDGSHGFAQAQEDEIVEECETALGFLPGQFNHRLSHMNIAFSAPHFLSLLFILLTMRGTVLVGLHRAWDRHRFMLLSESEDLQLRSHIEQVAKGKKRDISSMDEVCGLCPSESGSILTL